MRDRFEIEQELEGERDYDYGGGRTYYPNDYRLACIQIELLMDIRDLLNRKQTQMSIIEKIESINYEYEQQIRDSIPEIKKFLEDLANEYLAKDDIDGIGIQSETDDEGNDYLGVWVSCAKADEEYYERNKTEGRSFRGDSPSQNYKEEIEAAIPLVLEKVCIEYGISVMVEEVK